MIICPISNMLVEIGRENGKRASLYFVIGISITLLITQVISDVPLRQSILSGVGIGVGLAISAFLSGVHDN
jgi:hypothetical protein